MHRLRSSYGGIVVPVHLAFGKVPQDVSGVVRSTRPVGSEGLNRGQQRVTSAHTSNANPDHRINDQCYHTRTEPTRSCASTRLRPKTTLRDASGERTSEARSHQSTPSPNAITVRKRHQPRAFRWANTSSNLFYYPTRCRPSQVAISTTGHQSVGIHHNGGIYTHNHGGLQTRIDRNLHRFASVRRSFGGRAVGESVK